MEEFEEAAGYRNEPGWVKGNPLNNDSYVAKAKEAYPEYAERIQEQYDDAKSTGKQFNVAQIKEKFGELRFYLDYLRE